MDPLILSKVQQSLQTLIEHRVLVNNKESEHCVEFSFVAPDAKFVADLSSRPKINAYLIGLSEDNHRRRSDPVRTVLNKDKTQHSIYVEPRYVDMTYMLTVWSKDEVGSAMIEHLLLGYLISGLGYFDFLPEDIQAEHELDTAPFGVRLTLFGSEYADKISGQVWQAMGSTPKPSLMLSLSVPVPIAEPGTRSAVRDIAQALNRM
ncbi:Pvc16 family protein [Alteromonas sp. a30]|uniref:Pvc16 family protein n=1 Tax=Alteromonas sp. a30 TaxID=2730917 RepID=UPI002282A319|nr:Pvc16 family protein [Alteromonas sp. a30]MCY7296495.1 DUF4255 domain-containing protein [Alteromonas sp. a30]